MIAFAAAPGTLRAQAVDLNRNGISDVWEWLYNAQGISPAADPDGDGFSNLQEAVAGTNPFDATSYPRIIGTVYGAQSISVTMRCAPGKLYELQACSALSSTNGDQPAGEALPHPSRVSITLPHNATNWVALTNIVARSGTNVTLTVAAPAVMQFYRVAISDVDSDGDGVNDWEEYQLGLNPLNADSNGQEDANGNALSDYAYVTNQLASQNVITIAATQPTATEPDPGQKAPSTGLFTITRGGFPLDSITVNLAPGRPGTGAAISGVDYAALPATVTLAAGASTQTIALTPLADTNLTVPVLAQLQLLAGSNYTVGPSNDATVVVYPSPTAGGAGLLGQYYHGSDEIYTNSANFNPTNLFLTRVDPAVAFDWTNGTSPNLSTGAFSVRWTGQVQPQFSETCVFDVFSDDGCRLWVNDQLLIDQWHSQGATDWTNSITLQAGVRYDLKLEYLQVSETALAYLSWYSPSQPEEVIPSSRLYVTNQIGGGGSNAPAVVTSVLSAVAFLGQPFAFTVSGANTPLGYAARGLPPGLIFNPANGLITGVPALAGSFQIALTASNHIGAGASILSLTVLSTGSSVVEEVWTNVPGTNVTDIPAATPASFTNVLGALQGPTNYAANYGELVRGYFTAPATANYYFWIAGSDSAQLAISDDSEPVNQVVRAWVTPTNNPTAPGHNGTSPLQWNLQANQRSGWLSLAAGQKYYLEVRHKAGAGTGHNWAVGWLQDPTGTNTAPAGLAPGWLLSRYYPPLPAAIPGTLYSASLLALPGVASDGVGSATLRVNASGTQATLNWTFTNLVGAPTGESVNSDPYLGNPAELIFDIAGNRPQPNGSYIWNIKSAGPLAASDVLEIINDGMADIVIQSSAFPNGELGGHFTLANGSQAFTAPPAPPAWADDSASENAAVRFLDQATFGPSASDIATVQSGGYRAWLTNQFALPATHGLTNVLASPNSNPNLPWQSPQWFAAWWRQSVTAPDQLRQRVAFALSEILVVSENGALHNHADALSSYYDLLADNAFGNFRSLLEAVTLSPAMGLYLNMLGNNAGSSITGLHADENYAREIQQLFTIGLNRLWPDGSLILNSQGNLVPTYGQNTVMGFASVFTGWNFYQTNQPGGRLPVNWYPSANYTNAMVLVPPNHELGPKLLLDNVVLPPASGNQANPASTNYDTYGRQDLESALNAIFNHPNVAPFVCRQLIQRLVTSDPSPDYVWRVAQVFNNDGTGVRGNLKAVVQAILLDYEARSPAILANPTYGKQREPLLRVTGLARAFPAPPSVSGAYSQTTNEVITITTSSPHQLASGDLAFMTFTDTSGRPAPPATGYWVTATNPTTLTVAAPQLATGSYGQTNGLLTVAIPANGLAVGNPVYLAFTTGGAASGLFLVTNVIDSTHFTAATSDPTLRTGNCLLPKISVGGYVQTGTNLLISTAGPDDLAPGNKVFIQFPAGTLANGIYPVASVADATHFTVTTTNLTSANQMIVALYSLNPPPLNRSGTVVIQENTWNMGYTDGGTVASLSQSPLRSPTVFNFFYPDYAFPGILAAAGLTTPEFQLTTDSGVAAQMNYIEGGIMNNAGNTNGLSSFMGGNGSLVLNFAPWMTPSYTTDAGVPLLVGSLNSFLAAGQLSAAAQASIIQYVANQANFPCDVPPTPGQMRDRVRAVVHLIVSAPDYLIQK